jgi:hypothetical protein
MVEEVLEISLANVKEEFYLTLSEFDEFPELTIEVYESNMKKGAQDQVFVVVEGAANALLMMKDEYMIAVERVFNLGLVQKGPCPWGRNHCLDLADQLID